MSDPATTGEEVRCALLPNDGSDTCLTQGKSRDRACAHCEDIGWPDAPQDEAAGVEWEDRITAAKDAACSCSDRYRLVFGPDRHKSECLAPAVVAALTDQPRLRSEKEEE